MSSFVQFNITMSAFTKFSFAHMQSGMKLSFIPSCIPVSQSSTQSDKYQVSHKYSYFSWWWAQSPETCREKK